MHNFELEKINKKIIKCTKCPRLTNYLKQVSKNKVKRFVDENYWGKPLPGFGDSNGRLLIVGLAPAAHGGNRTGRMFTGDSSADWLSQVLYEHNFASIPTSQRIDDGFYLIDSYMTAAARCAPPQNKPLKEELDNCSIYLENEIKVLKNIQIILCLGKIAFDSVLKVLKIKHRKFSHGYSFEYGGYIIMCSYHPSRQNTQTGRLAWKEWNKVFSQIQDILENKQKE